MITDQDLATSLATAPNSWPFVKMAIDVWLWSFGENPWKELLKRNEV